METQNTLKIFVGGLSFETTDEKLNQYFQQWGQVIDAIVMTDNVSKRSRGFGFVTFADAASVDLVLVQPELVIDGRRVEAKRAVPRSDLSPNAPVFSVVNQDGFPLRSDSFSRECPSNFSDEGEVGFQENMNAKIFVGGLHYDTRDNCFRNYFEQFGKVMAAEVMFNRETHKSRGFGFVVFESVESAQAVLRHPHHSINGKLVEVKRAVPRVVPNHGSIQGSLSPAYLSPESTPTRHRAYQGLNESFAVIDEKYRNVLSNDNLSEQHLENIKRFAAVAAVAAADSYAAALGYNSPSQVPPPQSFSPGFGRSENFSPNAQLSSSLPPSMPFMHSFPVKNKGSDPSMFNSGINFNSSERFNEKRFSEIWDIKPPSSLNKAESEDSIFANKNSTPQEKSRFSSFFESSGNYEAPIINRGSPIDDILKLDSLSLAEPELNVKPLSNNDSAAPWMNTFFDLDPKFVNASPKNYFSPSNEGGRALGTSESGGYDFAFHTHSLKLEQENNREFTSLSNKYDGPYNNFALNVPGVNSSYL
mmetsp:Transcript_16493/g.23285  ORF Transcript_16493/g.23285 Transcript_16493/m.23285 type:complete len:532 (-) Transcript_16493:289-1884(-)